MSARSRAGLVATVGFVILGLLGPVMVITFRFLLSGDLSDASSGAASSMLMTLSRASAALSVLAWLLVLGGLFAIYRRRPAPMLQATLGLWSAALAMYVLAYALIPFTPESNISERLGSGSVALEAFGIATALLFHHADQAPRDRVLAIAALAALNYALYLVPHAVYSESGELLQMLATATNAILYLGLAALPWSAKLEEGDARPPTAAPEARRHFIAGGIAIAVGLLLTLGSFAIGGIDGRALLAWGPIVYGVIRVFQGLTASGRA